MATIRKPILATTQEPSRIIGIRFKVSNQYFITTFSFSGLFVSIKIKDETDKALYDVEALSAEYAHYTSKEVKAFTELKLNTHIPTLLMSYDITGNKRS